MGVYNGIDLFDIDRAYVRSRAVFTSSKVVTALLPTPMLIVPQNNRRLYIRFAAGFGTTGLVSLFAGGDGENGFLGDLSSNAQISTNLFEFSLRFHGDLVRQSFFAFSAGGLQSLSWVEVITDDCCEIGQSSDPYPKGDSRNRGSL
jgi:hypothetical protein